MIIIQRINWSLFNDEKIIIEKNNIDCEYFENKLIKYVEDNNTINLVNLEKKIYIRENNEFIFKVDFKKKIFNYILKEKEINLENSINCEFINNFKEIILKYKLGEEEKKILIQIL